MDRIKILRDELAILEQDKSKQIFLRLINHEKLDFLNDQLEIIKKKLEITNILLEEERNKNFVQNIIGRPLKPDKEKRKSIIDMIIKNKDHMSPTILGLYGNELDEEKVVQIQRKENNALEKEENIKVNIDQYLEMDDDSDYENSIIEKLKNLEINDEKVNEYVDIKPNLPPPVVVPPGQTSSFGSNVTNENWRVNEEEQANPTRKNIDRRQYFIRKTNDYIPTKYIPYDKEPQALNPTGIYLDLDCVEDREKILTMWIKENGAVINKEGMTKEQGMEFLRRTMRGSVERYIESLGESYDAIKNESENILKFLSNLEKLIRLEFIGYYDATTENLRIIDKENAIKGMMNISICDMCYFDQYTCEYTDWFYKARFKDATADYEFYSKMYYEKFPEPFRTKLIRDFDRVITKEQDMKTSTLGTKIWFARKKLTDYCIEAKEQRQIYKYQKRQYCCPKNNEVGQYGYNKPYKKRKKWKFRKTSFKTYNDKNRYFRKRKRFNKVRREYKEKNNSSNSNQKKVKKCTCFICKEEGHYANQCPKRNKRDIKILNEVYNCGFEPLESEVESEYSLYSASITSRESSDNE